MNKSQELLSLLEVTKNKVYSSEEARELILSGKFPDSMEVRGHLDLNNTKVTSLPNDLKVGGYLDLENTKVTSLPNNLEVSGDLVLWNTKITSLPNDLKVGERIGMDDYYYLGKPNPKVSCDRKYKIHYKITDPRFKDDMGDYILHDKVSKDVFHVLDQDNEVLIFKKVKDNEYKDDKYGTIIRVEQ